MEMISTAGTAWLYKNRLTMNQLINRWRRNEPILRRAHPLDGVDAPEDDGIISYKDGYWLMRQETCRFEYLELRTGHAKLTLCNGPLPESVLTSLYRSAKPVEDVVSMSHDCLARHAGGKIIRADIHKNSTVFLMRIDWQTTTSVHALERI